jgi:hypothetical protein
MPSGAVRLRRRPTTSSSCRDSAGDGALSVNSSSELSGVSPVSPPRSTSVVKRSSRLLSPCSGGGARWCSWSDGGGSSGGQVVVVVVRWLWWWSGSGGGGQVVGSGQVIVVVVKWLWWWSGGCGRHRRQSVRAAWSSSHHPCGDACVYELQGANKLYSSGHARYRRGRCACSGMLLFMAVTAHRGDRATQNTDSSE